MKKYLYVMLMEDKNPLNTDVIKRHGGHLRVLPEAGPRKRFTKK